MSIESGLGYNQVRKNDYGFSFISAMFDLAGNGKFKSAQLSTLCSDYDTATTNVWRTLSAIGQELGSQFNERIVNFIDNVSNVELCKTHNLDSLANMTGIKYTVFQNISLFPQDIIKLLDVLSMKREYLLAAEKMNSALTKHLSAIVLDSDDEAKICCQEINDERKRILVASSDMSSIWQPEVSATSYIDDEKLDATVSSMYRQLMLDKVTQTYNDYARTLIYKNLSSSILLSGFSIPNAYADDIKNLKIQNNVPLAFNEQAEVDKIESMDKSLDDYSAYEQEILRFEIKRRNDAFNALQPQTRCKFYREREVREYFSFIEQQYTNLSSLYENASIYAVDPTYIQLDNTSVQANCLIDSKCNLKTQMVDTVAVMLLNMTKNIREVREQLKSQIQKNFMRGSYLLLQFMINEYLKSTVIPNINSLSLQPTSKTQPISVSWDQNKSGNDLIEYSDATQYFNISTEVDLPFDKCNERYWEHSEKPLVDYPDDSSNLFKLHSVVNQKNFVFAIDELDQFYRKILKNRFDPSNPDMQTATEQNKHLSKFLSAIFDLGAETSYMDQDGSIQTLIDGKLQPKTQIKLAEDIAAKYFALSTYDVGTFELNGTAYEQLYQLSSEFISGRANLFDSLKTDIISTIKDGLTSNVRQTISYDTKQLKNEFNQLTTTYKGTIIVPLASQYLADNIVSFMRNVQLSAESATKEAKVLLNNLSAQIESISADYDDLYAANSKLQSQKLNTVAWRKFDVHAASVDYTASITPLPTTPLRYLEDIADTYEAVIAANSTILDAVQASYDTRLCAALASYDTSWKALKQFKSAVSQFLSVEIQISGIAISVFNELSVYDSILSSKEALFSKYTGLSVGSIPYMNLENKRHPSYQIHPCLSNFVEIDDVLYPIQNTVALVNDNLGSLISGYVNELFDKDGYLTDIWKNPLNVNSDYMSRYEAASHTNAMNNEDPMYGYDGLFYPTALTTYFDKPDKLIAAVQQNQDLQINAYKGLNLTDAEAKFIANQLDTFQSIVRSEATQEYHDIYRYGLDLYGNQYILVKSYPSLNIHSFEDLLKVDQQVRKDTPGVLWMKPKNHPIAFPAFALTYKKTLDGVRKLQYAKQSNVFIADNDNDANPIFIDSSILQFQQINDSNYYAPCICDFTVSKGKTILLVNAKTKYGVEWPLIAKVSQYHDKDLDRTVRKLVSDVKGENAVDCLFEESQLAQDFEGYSFLKYFNIGMYPGAMFYKNVGTARDPKFSFKGNWYDYSSRSDYDQCRHQTKTNVDISIDTKLPLLPGTQVCFDICTDKDRTNACILKMAYLTDKFDPHNLSNYQNVIIPDYYTLSTWIDTPRNCIIARNFTVYPEEIYEDDGAQCTYLPYVDHGFNPLHENVENDSADTQLPYHLLKKRGILKYQMLGRSKAYGIDFKHVIPVRMFDPYTVSADSRYVGSMPGMHYDNLNAADYMMQHFDESMLSTGCQLIDTNGSIYSLYEFKQKIPNWKLCLRVDESYISFMKARGFSPRDPLVDYTYLWRVNAEDGEENDIPDNYVKAYDPSYTAQLTSEFDLNLFKNKDGYHHLSVSWYYANDSIGIDINSYYYTVLDERNVFNRKHKFLSLPKSGDGGILQEWHDADEDSQEDDLLATYFIKNISDKKPRFLLSVCFNAEDEIIESNIVPETNAGIDRFVVEFELENMDLVTEEGTKLAGE